MDTMFFVTNLARRRVEQITGPPAQITNITPPGGSVDQQLDLTITWVKPLMAKSYNVYFGTESGNLSLIDNRLARSYAPPGLVLDTTYYVRIDAVNSLGVTTGVECSFSTWAAADIWTDEETGIPWTDDLGNYIPHEKDEA